MSRTASRLGRVGIVVSVIGLLGLALGFGIAQATVVTQAEWAVYMTRGLRLDWNLPLNAKSDHYLARLDWTNGVEFQAAQMLDGSTATSLEDGSVQSEPGEPSEALYQVATLRAGDYGFRVKLGGGGAVLKVSDRAYELFQPDMSPRWVDLDRVALNPGEHPMSLMLIDGARAESLGVTPPCMTPLEPIGGWEPLEPLTFHEMAVTLAKALDLEGNLPELGDPITIRGEEFRKTLFYPYEEELPVVSEDDPFWLSSGSSITAAVARFEVPEDGVYSIETRYISPRPIRWALDSCLRVVTCPITASQIGRRRSLALELDAGEHVLEVTLPPGAKLDRVDVQRRDGAPEEYASVVEDEGFRLGQSEEPVRRRDAVRAARRLRDRFDKLTKLRCSDELIAMEAEAIAMAAAAGAIESSSTNVGAMASGPNAPPMTTQASPGGPPMIPPVDSNDGQSGSPVEPAR